jgi:hypothetical protein
VGVSYTDNRMVFVDRGPQFVSWGPYSTALIEAGWDAKKLRILEATYQAMVRAEQQLAAQYRWTPYRAYVKAMRGNT